MTLLFSRCYATTSQRLDESTYTLPLIGGVGTAIPCKAMCSETISLLRLGMAAQVVLRVSRDHAPVRRQLLKTMTTVKSWSDERFCIRLA